MLESFFGWRKASRCKKFIRQVQSRLKLLKNKKSSIARQLRGDVAQLLRHGHEQNAFERVEQIFLDERIVVVYDLLDHFCEFIIIHFSYIRKHKDCPNDIGEAVSTLIFASARCGDLPELPEIRELFGERYGQRFVAVSLNLLPGNLVNRQIKENLSVQSVADDVKLSLVDEIWRSYCHQTGPLAIEYFPQFQEQAIQKWEDEVVTSDIQSKYTISDQPQMQGFHIAEEERKIVYIDVPSEMIKLSDIPHYSSPNSFELSTNSYKESSMEKNTSPNYPCEIKITEKKEDYTGVESSSEISQRPRELVYLDDIEEYNSPMSTHVNSKDQRLFMFKSTVIISAEKLDTDLNEGFVENRSSLSEKLGSRRSGKSKRQRRRSISWERTNVNDIESAIYYGERHDNSRISQRRRKHHKRIGVYEIKKSCVPNLEQSFGAQIKNNESKIRGAVHECSIIEPCYFCTSNDKDDHKTQEMKMITSTRYSMYNHHSLSSAESKKSSDKEGLGVHAKEETNTPYLRAMTMPPQRKIDAEDGNMNRSNSFPFQKPTYESPYCRHVHPKLPDYDQLEATFTALKKANSQIKSK